MWVRVSASLGLCRPVLGPGVSGLRGELVGTVTGTNQLKKNMPVYSPQTYPELILSTPPDANIWEQKK